MVGGDHGSRAVTTIDHVEGMSYGSPNNGGMEADNMLSTIGSTSYLCNRRAKAAHWCLAAKMQLVALL